MNPILILPGRISYADLKDTDESVFAPFRGGEGVIHKGRKYIEYASVNYGVTEDNPCRAKGSTRKKVIEIADSRRQGIDPNAELPCVSESETELPYDGENGMTRYKADKYNGQDHGAWMDIVEFVATEGRTAKYNRFVYLHGRNDGLPQGNNSVEDVVSSATQLIYSGDLELREGPITAFVYEASPNMTTQEKNKAIRVIIKEEEVPTVTINWQHSECKDWLENKCLDDIGTVDYCFPYHYFQDRVYSLMKQYHLVKRKLKVIQHFDNTGDSDQVVLDARINQAKKWEEFRQICKSLALYMLNNDWELPFDVDTAFPQIKSGDHQEDQNRVVNL